MFTEVFMTVSIILYVLFSALIIGLAVLGFTKGTVHGAVCVLRTLASALLAFLFVRLIALIIPADKILAIVSGAMSNGSGAITAAAVSLIGAAIFSVILPFIFGILFLLFFVVLIAPSRALTRLINKKIEAAKAANREKSLPEDTRSLSAFPADKVGGATVRVIDAFLIAVFVLMPFSGIFYTLSDGIDSVLEAAEKYELEISDSVDISEIRDEISDKTSDVGDNLFMRLSYSAPMKSFYSVVGASKGSDFKNGNELDQTLKLCSKLVCLTADLDDYGSSQIDAVNSIGTYVSQSYFHSIVAANLVSEVSSELIESSSSELNDSPFSAVLMPLIYGLKNSTPENIGPNLTTFSVIAAEIIDSGVLSDMDNAENMLANEDFLVIVITSVLENEHLRDTTAEMINSSLCDIILKINENASISDMKVLVTSENFENIDVKAEAKVIAHVISTSYKASSVFMDEFVMSNPDVYDSMKRLGAALDDARESKILSEIMDSFVLSVVGSSKLTNSPDKLTAIVNAHLGDEGLSYENLFSSTASLMKIFESSKNSEKDDAVVSISVALEQLTSTLDPVTSQILKEFVSAAPELFYNSTADGDVTDAETEESGGQKLVNLFISKLISGEITDDDYDREAKALDYAVRLVTMKDSDGISSVKDVYGTSDGMNEMITLFIDSKITADAITELAYDEHGNLNQDALNIAADFDSEDERVFIAESESIYREKAAQDDTDISTIRSNLIAVASIFGMDITENIDSWNN